jgi:hypothetical protein
MAARIRNFAEWAPHLVDDLRRESERNADRHIAALLAEVECYVPRLPVPEHHLGFAVPLHLASPVGELRLLSTCTTFATAADVTVSELRLEAFLPADDATAEVLVALAEDRRARLSQPYPPPSDAGEGPGGASA